MADYKVKIHPLAKIFPETTGEAYQKIKDDIRRNGQRVSIMYIEVTPGIREIIDGRTRYKICKEIGIEPQMKRITVSKNSRGEPETLAEAVASLNFHRRDLSPSQRATVGAELESAIQEEREEIKAKLEKEAASRAKERKDAGRPSIPKPKLGRATHEAAKKAGTSHGSVEMAKVVKKVDPELFSKVKEGTIKVSSAYKQVQDRLKREALDKAAEEAAKEAKEARDRFNIIIGDCVEKMKELPAESFNLIVADPPYNIGIDYGDGKDADSMSRAEYLSWTTDWLAEATRLLTPNGQIWLIIGKQHRPFLGEVFSNCGLEIVNDITWFESFGQNRANNFNLCSRAIFQLQKTDAESCVMHKHVFNRPSDRQDKYNDKRAAAGGKWWDDVWGINPPIPRVTGNSEERVPGFPTQLPEILVRAIVHGCTEPADHVLDPFSGSGTTCVVCMETPHLKFTGIEKQEKFAKMSEKRILAKLPQSADANGAAANGKKKKKAPKDI